MSQKGMDRYDVTTVGFSAQSSGGVAVKFEQGDEVYFDGRALVVLNGEEYNIPRMRSAVKARWITKAVDGQAPQMTRRPSAGINVRAATPQQENGQMQGVTSVEDRELGTVAARDAALQEARQGGDYTPLAPVRQLTPAKTEGRDVNQRFRPQGQQLASAHQARTATVSEGIRMTGTNLSAQAQGVPVDAYNAAPEYLGENAGTVVGTVSGGEFFGEPGGDIFDDVVMEQLQEVATAPVVEEREELDLEDAEARYLLAKMIIPDLPDWDFSLHWKTKIRELAGWKDPYHIRAVFAAESGKMRKQIRSKYSRIIDAA